MAKLYIFTSTVSDGTIRDSEVRNILNDNGRTFLEKNTVNLADAELVYLTYEGNTRFTRYTEATCTGSGIIRPTALAVDGLVTTQAGHALVLPVADCIGAVLYDQTKNVLMLSHLGRHNLEQSGGTKSVEYMAEQFNCHPENITAWLSPAAGGKNYPLYDFAGRSMHDIASEQLQAAGLLAENITRSLIDTTTDKTYFSHSEYKKGNRVKDGRFAVVAILKN